MVLGLEITESIERVVARLAGSGVRFQGSIIRDASGNFANFEDPDGNEMYLWEVNPAAVPESEFSQMEQ